MNATSPGGFGKFTMSKDISKYTRAMIYEKIGKKTGGFIRFTTVADEHGDAYAEFHIPVSAMLFSAGEGSRDPVGNNTPVFFLRDPTGSRISTVP
jgi:catalase